MLAYKTYGAASAVPLVFVHGFPFNAEIWHEQVVFDDTYYLIMVDLPGFGASPLEKPPEEVTIDWMAEEVKEVLDYLQVERAVLVGHSMGGYVALAFAEKFAERLIALSMVCSHARADTAEVRQRRYQWIELVQSAGVEAVAKALLPNLFSPLIREYRPELVDWVYQLMLAAPPDAVIGALYAMARRPDRLHVLQGFRLPLWVSAGADDQIVPRERVLEMVEAASDSELVVIPAAGHMVMLEQPEAFNEAYLQFLERID